ncbi:leucyl/phenylalanyl-tRNA--protein transferase [Shimia ponticola]|uniref:leucyl/phenylalanyl-tRNA--protein transferase n=1 Tax=Shimia ponticola TaxID=2582893 RepID=UPI0011BFD037|nr:leucyl/phenylalanyl-tRNA--protein transferase [Shimia ponticola]
MRDDSLPLTPELLLRAYMAGIFPMAETRHATDVFWVDPERRGIIPLDGLILSRSLRRTIRRQNYDIRLNTDFDGVVRGCAARDETWINNELHQLYSQLFEAGFAHAIEVWMDGELAGGIFGIAIAGAFFGESMFSARRDASKIAMVYLVDLLKRGNFSLFDTQFTTDHLRSLGGTEIPRSQYQAKLKQALAREASFVAPGLAVDAQDVLQRSTHTS